MQGVKSSTAIVLAWLFWLQYQKGLNVNKCVKKSHHIETASISCSCGDKLSLTFTMQLCGHSVHIWRPSQLNKWDDARDWDGISICILKDDDRGMTELGYLYVYWLLGPLLLTWFNWVKEWICNHIHYFLWNVITHPCPNFNGGLTNHHWS